MFWPDYSLHKKRKRAWRVPAFLLTLLLGLLVAGFRNGWWQFRNLERESRIESAVITAEKSIEGRSLNEAVPTFAPLPTPRPLKEAADFALPDLFDETIILRRSDYDGHPLILNFWASWCVPCREEMPALQRAYDEYGPAGLTVLGVNETYVDDLDAAQAFVTELGLTFPSVRDDTGETSDKLYRVMGLPTSVFVTPDGKVAHVQIGQMSEEQIQFFSSQLVAGGTISP